MTKRRICIFPCSTLIFLCFMILPNSEGKSISKEVSLLEKIILSKVQNTMEIKILFSPYSSYRHFELYNPNRIVVDSLNIEDIKTARHYDVDDFAILVIRAGMFKKNIARVVFDLKEKIPSYKIEKIEGGLKAIFWVEKALPEEKEENKAEESQQEKLEVKSENIKELEKEIKGIKEATDKIDEKLKETEKALDETNKILKMIQNEQANQTRRFVRIEAVWNYFQPSEGVLKDVYENGLMEGAELSVGIWNYFEFWVAMKNFSKKVVDEASEEDRRVRMIPIEAGLKLRLNKGVINPYLGVGAGYHQYKESNPSGEIKEKEIGYIGQAGCFLKIADNLVLDIYAHYRYCLITTGATEFNIGGLHLGAGFGFEF